MGEATHELGSFSVFISLSANTHVGVTDFWFAFIFSRDYVDSIWDSGWNGDGIGKAKEEESEFVLAPRDAVSVS